MDKTIAALIVITVIIVGITLYADFSDPTVGFFK